MWATTLRIVSLTSHALQCMGHHTNMYRVFLLASVPNLYRHGNLFRCLLCIYHHVIAQDQWTQLLLLAFFLQIQYCQPWPLDLATHSLARSLKDLLVWQVHGYLLLHRVLLFLVNFIQSYTNLLNFLSPLASNLISLVCHNPSLFVQLQWSFLFLSSLWPILIRSSMAQFQYLPSPVTCSRWCNIALSELIYDLPCSLRPLPWLKNCHHHVSTCGCYC